MAKKKASIDEFKDRMTAPVGAVRIDPKTRKPISSTKRKGKK